jgi:hypothetical protein
VGKRAGTDGSAPSTVGEPGMSLGACAVSFTPVGPVCWRVRAVEMQATATCGHSRDGQAQSSKGCDEATALASWVRLRLSAL